MRLTLDVLGSSGGSRRLPRWRRAGLATCAPGVVSDHFHVCFLHGRNQSTGLYVQGLLLVTVQPNAGGGGMNLGLPFGRRIGLVVSFPSELWKPRRYRLALGGMGSHPPYHQGGAESPQVWDHGRQQVGHG